MKEKIIGSIKKFATYKYKWELLDNQNYDAWIPTNNLFPYNDNNISEYNLTKLIQYYKLK